MMDEHPDDEYGFCPNCNRPNLHISMIGESNGVICCYYCHENVKENMNKPLVGRQYQHYKGGLYTVTGLSTHSETLEEMVEYYSENHKTNWVRPLSVWNKKTDDGQERFKLLPGIPKGDPIYALRKMLQSDADHQYQKGRGTKYYSVDSLLDIIDTFLIRD